MTACTRCGYTTGRTPESLAAVLREISEEALLGLNTLVALQLERLALELASGECILCIRRPHQPSGARCSCGAVNHAPVPAACRLCGGEIRRAA